MEEISLNLSNTTLRLLSAVELEENVTRMEECISMYSLASSRLSLSTQQTNSTISALTEILNQFVLRQDAFGNMSERTVTSYSSLVLPQERGEQLTELLLRDGLTLSLVTLKSHFLRQYVQTLREIGCFRSTEYYSTPSMLTPRRSHHMNHRPSLLRGDALHSSESGSTRQPLAELSGNGTSFLILGYSSGRQSKLKASLRIRGGPHPPLSAMQLTYAELNHLSSGDQHEPERHFGPVVWDYTATSTSNSTWTRTPSPRTTQSSTTYREGSSFSIPTRDG